MNNRTEQITRKIDLFKRKKELLEKWQIEKTEKAIAKIERYRATRERNYNQAIERLNKELTELQ